MNKDQLRISISDDQTQDFCGQKHTPSDYGILEAIEAAAELEDISQLRDAVQQIKGSLLELVRKNPPPVDADAQYVHRALTQVEGCQSTQRAQYYLKRLIKGLTEVKTNRVNDINLNRWKEYPDIITDSLWVLNRRDRSGVHSAQYWGNFIPQIPNQLIRRFTKPGDWVLDTFAGSGTTLIESQRLGRNCLGVELNPEIAQTARELVAAEPNQHSVCCEIVEGDATKLDIRSQLEPRGTDKAQLVIMHPPYHDIIKFNEDPRDLSNAPDTDAFLKMLGDCVRNIDGVVAKGAHLGLVIADKFAAGEWIPLGFLCSQEVSKRGYTMKSAIVKNFEETAGKRKQKELWRYRALAGGYYIFKHEYIFLFTKT